MKKVIIILAEGFEELEAVTVVDILRRAEIDVTMVGLQNLSIKGAHNIILQADCLLTDIKAQEFDGIILPGGLPGSESLAKSSLVKKLLRDFSQQGKLVSAICAAPWALSTANVLKEHYTCYPSFEKIVDHKGYQEDKNVVVCGNTITSRGPATAMEFALQLVKYLSDEKNFNKVADGLLFSKLN